MQWLQRSVGLAIIGLATLGAGILWVAVASGDPESGRAPDEGLLFGIWQWVERMGTLTPTPTGTLLLAALPLVLGFQLLLQAWVMDIANVPSRSRWAGRRRDEPAG